MYTMLGSLSAAAPGLVPASASAEPRSSRLVIVILFTSTTTLYLSTGRGPLQWAKHEERLQEARADVDDPKRPDENVRVATRYPVGGKAAGTSHGTLSGICRIPAGSRGARPDSARHSESSRIRAFEFPHDRRFRRPDVH